MGCVCQCMYTGGPTRQIACRSSIGNEIIPFVPMQPSAPLPDTDEELIEEAEELIQEAADPGVLGVPGFNFDRFFNPEVRYGVGGVEEGWG